MTLRSANLNLLPVLRALLAEASITRAATVVGLSQPATSHALARLRELFGDPLLIQVGRTMRLTPRGQDLRARVDAVCAGIEDLLFDYSFDPAGLVRDFTIATPDYMALILGPMLIRTLAESAPGVTVRIIDVGDDFTANLTSGRVDIAIVAHAAHLRDRLKVMEGYTDRLVGIVARDHPLAQADRVTAENLEQYPRLGIDVTIADLARYGRLDVDQGKMAREVEAHAALMGPGGPLRLSPSHLLALPLLIARTDAIAIIPAALAEETVTSAPIVSFELPLPAPPLDISMLWSPVIDADPALIWFRSVLDGALRQRFGG